MESRNAGKSGPEMTPGKSSGNGPGNEPLKEAPINSPENVSKAGNVMISLGTMAKLACILSAHFAAMGKGGFAGFYVQEVSAGMTADITGSLITAGMPGKGGTGTDEYMDSQPDG